MTQNKSKFDSAWSGWKPAAVTEHEIKNVLALSTPMQRLQWLADMIDSLQKFKKQLAK